jgi:hypothetical protein
MPSLYEISVPVFIRSLKNLSAFLKKGEEYAKEKNIDLLNARLAPDMRSLPFQIQTASNSAKNALVRVASVEAVPMDDNETTFEQLYQRIERTIKLLEDVDEKVFEGKENAEVEMRGMKFTGQSYLLLFAIPNFYFHVMAAYAILRKEGVPVGKQDFLGSQQ